MKKNLFRIAASITMGIALCFSVSVLSGCQKDEEMIDAPRKDIVLTKAQTEYVQAGNQFTFNWLNVVNEKQNGD